MFNQALNEANQQRIFLTQGLTNIPQDKNHTPSALNYTLTIRLQGAPHYLWLHQLMKRYYQLEPT